jgi:hypothetical protein
VWQAAMAAILASAVFAQSSGSISGTVKDSKGGVIAGANVAIADPNKAVTQTTTSGAEGDFIFPLLPPGTYTLSVSAAGFKKREESNVVVSVSTRVNVGDIVLELAYRDRK